MRGWQPSIAITRVVPERSAPSMKIGLFVRLMGMGFSHSAAWQRLCTQPTAAKGGPLAARPTSSEDETPQECDLARGARIVHTILIQIVRKARRGRSSVA